MEWPWVSQATVVFGAKSLLICRSPMPFSPRLSHHLTAKQSIQWSSSHLAVCHAWFPHHIPSFSHRREYVRSVVFSSLFRSARDAHDYGWLNTSLKSREREREGEWEKAPSLDISFSLSSINLKVSAEAELLFPYHVEWSDIPDEKKTKKFKWMSDEGEKPVLPTSSRRVYSQRVGNFSPERVCRSLENKSIFCTVLPFPSPLLSVSRQINDVPWTTTTDALTFSSLDERVSVCVKKPKTLNHGQSSSCCSRSSRWPRCLCLLLDYCGYLGAVRHHYCLGCLHEWETFCLSLSIFLEQALLYDFLERWKEAVQAFAGTSGAAEQLFSNHLLLVAILCLYGYLGVRRALRSAN